MKGGNLAVLYTKETRKVYATCSVAAEQTEQQSNRALCRSRDTSLCCLRHYYTFYLSISESKSGAVY
jgi:16S rRNA C967 or C1407 C5-methylase (RsmB/RsmF family)